MPPFDARPYLKEIARGRSARPLTREQARVLFESIFADEIDPVALGAVLAAMRVKGETAFEVAGMMEALAPHVNAMRLPTAGPRPVLIASYNGARKLANLVPLLALLLARHGVPVVIHGLFVEAGRVSTFEVLQRLHHARDLECGLALHAHRREHGAERDRVDLVREYGLEEHARCSRVSGRAERPRAISFRYGRASKGGITAL